MKHFIYELKLWYKLNKGSVDAILAGIGMSIAIAGIIMIAKMQQP